MFVNPRTAKLGSSGELLKIAHSRGTCRTTDYCTAQITIHNKQL